MPYKDRGGLGVKHSLHREEGTLENMYEEGRGVKHGGPGHDGGR